MKSGCRDKTWLALAAALLATAVAQGAWYWPFGSDSKDEPKRLSELTEKASELIDEADGLYGDGKVDAAVEKYREALVELDKVERENPERAATPEFQTVRTKRGIVTSAISQINMAEARQNAKAVQLTDTAELEERLKRLRRERAVKPGEDGDTFAAPEMESQLEKFRRESREKTKQLDLAGRRAKARREVTEEIARLLEDDPKDRRARLLQAGEDLREGKTARAQEALEELVAEKPDDAAAMNMLGVCAAVRGKTAEAKKILEAARTRCPDDWHACYNLANLALQTSADPALARTYYEEGRSRGAPRNAALAKKIGLKETAEEKDEQDGPDRAGDKDDE